MSLALDNFCVGMIAVSSHFSTMAHECASRKKARLLVIYARVFIVHASGTNLFSLVLERFIAVVKPLKYFT